MARSSTLVIMEIAVVEANNTDNQNGITECSAKLEQLQDKIDELGEKKKILVDTYAVYFDLKEYIESHLASLEETSVCITEIKAEATEQISGKINNVLKVLEALVGQIDTAINNANTDYDTTYGQLQNYQTNLNNGQQRLGTLNTELEQAKAQELPTM